jgi:solute carrier family 35, member F3/4
MAFCILWLVTTYLYTLSLNILHTTESMVLFATNVACVYLLSWVILHEQFVGIRVSKLLVILRTGQHFVKRGPALFFLKQIVAVILCDTGIALLAYMDGITGSKTLKGVVLAILAAAGYGVFKVRHGKSERKQNQLFA